MKKCVTSSFVLAFLVIMILINLFSNGMPPVRAVTNVDTSLSITVNPSNPEASKFVDVRIWVDPPPPSPSERFHGLTLTIKRPDGITNDYTAFTRSDDGAYYWTYKINQMGNFTFQCSFSGEYFAEGTIWYRPSLSPVLTITATGDTKPPVEVQGGSWTKKESMSQARASLGVAVANGKIYAIGGVENATYLPSYGSGFLDTNEEYDPTSNTWTTKKSMPTPRSNFAIAVYDNKVYCMGGVFGNRLDDIYHLFHVAARTSRNEVYDPLTDTWETKTPMPVEESDIQAHVVNGEIYVINGRTVKVYDPVSDSWSTKSSPPFGLDSFVSAVVDDKIYLIGNYLPVLIYDVEKDSWSEGARSPRLGIIGPAQATTGLKAPKRIYVFAVAEFGWVPYGESDIYGDSRRTSFVYNPESDTWTAGERIPTYRISFGIAAFNDILFVIGGGTFENSSNYATVSSINEQYTPIGYGTPNQSPSPSPSPTPTLTPPLSSSPSQELTDTSVPFSTIFVISASVIVVILGGLGLWFYFKKRKL
jgi:hypothetical protein